MASDKEFKIQRFGRYLLLDHLVDGGMAKICRARFLGEQADKVVAIKMIQPQFSSDPSFRRMFMDELKVAFGLIHPNIAQTYDYGVWEDQLYTAMEYVDGKNLKEALDRLKVKKFVFPIEISVYAMSQVCQGLSYAHNFKDKLSGKHINIIHRDISPHNIMMTYDGALKIIDFGIAKAETNSESTRAGTIKGKLSYLAPEYLEGHPLDHRYDQFAVGITLWEMLCNRKLFTANNELAILKKIQECKVPPPSSINPRVPKELDAICLKALARNREDRFKDMEQFNRALIKFLYSSFPDFNASDVSYFAQELFKEEIENDQSKMVEFGKIDIMPFLKDLEEEKTSGGKGGQSISAAELVESGKAGTRIEIDLGMQDESAGESDLEIDDSKTRSHVLPGSMPKKSTGQTRKIYSTDPNAIKMEEMGKLGVSPHTGVKKTSSPKASRKKFFYSAVGLLAAILVGGSYLGLDKKEDEKDLTNDTHKKESQKPVMEKEGPTLDTMEESRLPASTGDTSKEPSESSVSRENQEVETEKPSEIPQDAPREVASSGTASAVLEEKPKQKVESQKKVEPQKGYITFENLNPTTMNIFINDTQIVYTGLGIKIDLNKKIKLRIEEPDKIPYIEEFELTSESPSKHIVLKPLREVLWGTLFTSDNISEGTEIVISINGKEEKRVAPVKSWKIPASTRPYKVKIINRLFNRETVKEVMIEENKRTMISL